VRPATLPIVAAVDFLPMAVAEHQATRHAEVDAEHRARLAGAAYAGRVAPHALAAPPRRGQSPPAQRGADLPGQMRAADVRVGVVDVSDLAAQCRRLNHLAGVLDLGKLRHASALYADAARTDGDPRSVTPASATPPHDVGERVWLCPATR